MQKILTALLVLCGLLVLTSCKNTLPNIPSSSPDATIARNTSTVTTTVQTDAPTTTVSATTKKQAAATISSSTTNIRTTTTTTKVKCCQRYEEGSLVVLGGNWREREPGVENRIELMAKCTEKRPVVYKCPQCLEIALYEELEPLGHDFSSGKETVGMYPTVGQEGYYQTPCQRELCYEWKRTRTIPKRTGDYSTIDSCFEVIIDSGECYKYKAEDLEFSIRDERTWGRVPTITYDAESNSGTVSFFQKDESFVTYSFTVNLEKLAQGKNYTGRIKEDGTYNESYWSLSVNGTAN